MSNLSDDAQTIRRICEETSEAVREGTKGISISVPVTRSVARLIAIKLREAAAEAFPTDKDLSHDLENVADEYDSEAM